MANFTPGPWKANDNGHFIEVNADPLDKDRPLDMYSPAVAFAWNVGENTAQANADLIAAAPEMYASLKLALAYIVDENETRKTSFAPYDDEDEDYIEYIKPGEDAIKAIGDALTKADGKQAHNAL